MIGAGPRPLAPTRSLALEGKPLNDTPSSAQDLTALGWKPFFDAQLSDDERARCEPVRVMAVHRGSIAIAGAGFERLIPPGIPGAGAAETYPTVGDWLLVDRETQQPVRVLARANLFQRRAPGKDRRIQLIAANVDTLFVVASCNQDFSLARIERYLVLAGEVGVRPVVVLTKADLTDTADAYAEAARGLQPELRVEVVNARDPASVARLAAWCGMGETVALLGSSGVGKSTLVNTLRGSDSIATQAIREGDGTGRHTTTVREMHRLHEGGWLLDTPGMRELQLAEAATGLAEVFDDIEALALDCRFTNCSHGGEPGCAVRAAVADGSLEAVRLERWRKLAAEAVASSASLGTKKARERSSAAAARPSSRAIVEQSDDEGG
jgi:ribosome biogenesis GTPase